MAVVIAANRTRHPLDARTLARLAGQYAGRGVVGFGLSNDERRGRDRRLRARAFEIAERAGLLLAPHGGELRGPDHIRLCLDHLHADRLGHGVRVGRGPGAARPDRRLRGGPRGVPGLQRGARRLLRPDVGAAPAAARRRRDRRPRRRRPAAVRLAAGRASTPRCAPPTSSTTQLAELARMSVPGPPRWPRPRRRAQRRRDPSTAEHRTALGPCDADIRVAAMTVRGVAADEHRLVDQPDAEACCSTPSRTSRARASRSSVVAPPRLVSASVCLVERAARRPEVEAVALAEAGVLDQPGGAGLDRAVRAGPGRGTRRARPPALEDRVGEERAGAPGVVVRRRRAPSPCRRAAPAPRAYVGQRRPLARLDAEGAGQLGVPDRRAERALRNWKVTARTTCRAGSALNRLVR